ncbi:nuclear transport factor 2 family protein [Sphingomonas sp.]|uniref:YybH family protein n=1 Tax=Sphingomonas sp. TaxID=28214 RepID=UPI00286CBCB4|nr:nuclear transport factor 2 family protein [Sphingomonas sp.]
MRFLLTMTALAMAAQPLAAHPGEQHAPAAQPKTAPLSDKAAVQSVLSQYKAAIEKLDARGTERLFATDSAILETGGVEGNYANYLAHHLGPELSEFKSFHYSNYKIEVRFIGPVALATESYTYRIETKKGEVADRLGVATSVLRKIGGHWMILSMHNSARRPKAS